MYTWVSWYLIRVMFKNSKILFYLKKRNTYLTQAWEKQKPLFPPRK